MAQLHEHETRIGSPPPDCETTDARQIVASAIGYFDHNASQVDHPRYGCERLPVTSSHIESYVKELNDRVKATSQFWNNGGWR